jgi:hypothetical protein
LFGLRESRQEIAGLMAARKIVAVVSHCSLDRER